MPMISQIIILLNYLKTYVYTSKFGTAYDMDPNKQTLMETVNREEMITSIRLMHYEL